MENTEVEEKEVREGNFSLEISQMLRLKKTVPLNKTNFNVNHPPKALREN